MIAVCHVSLDSGLLDYLRSDEQWFTLNADLLRKALETTPVDLAHSFVSPPAGEQVMDFVNEPGYPKEIHFISKMHVNNLYQPLRDIMSLINQCLTRKTSGNDKPRYPVLQMLWGIVTRTNIDYAELLWEEFVQAIQIFFAHQANLNVPTKKPTPHVIPYYRFTKIIIFYFGSEHNNHRRPGSPVYVTRDDYLLGNLKFVPKGKKDEQYLEMVARKPITKEGGQKKTTSEADKPKKPTPEIRKGRVAKIRKGKSSLQLVDKDEEVQHEPEPQIEDDEYNLQQGIQMSLESFQEPVNGVAIREPTSGVTRSLLVVEGKGKGIATDEHRRAPVTEEASTRPLTQPEDDMSANIVCDTPSPPDAETGAEAKMSDSEGDTEILNVGEEKGKYVSNTVALEERTIKLDEG
ncbi:hypothetical protein Tco_0071771 [Tanacetum coccineum]